MYITFSALSMTELLHHHLKFVYTIPFSYQPIQHGPSAPEQKPSTVLYLSNSCKHSPPKHSWKLTLNLCLRGFFFSVFQFSTSVVFSFASTYSEMCAVDRNAFGKAVPRCTSLPCFSRGLLGFCVVCDLPQLCLPNKALEFNLMFRVSLWVPTSSPSFIF